MSNINELKKGMIFLNKKSEILLALAYWWFTYNKLNNPDNTYGDLFEVC